MGNLVQGRSTTDISPVTGRGRVEEIKSKEGASYIHVASSDVTGYTVSEEIYELIPIGTVGAASIASAIWVPTKNIVEGIVYATANAVTGTTAGSLNASYSMDGVNVVTTEAIGTAFTATAATAAETVMVGFNDLVNTADALGFARKIKQFPYVRFSVTLTNGTAAGTVECMAKVGRLV